MYTTHFIFNELETRCSLIWDDKGNCAIIDPGYKDAEKKDLVAFIESKKLNPVCIMLTHGHFDHIYGLADCARTWNIPVYMDVKEK